MRSATLFARTLRTLGKVLASVGTGVLLFVIWMLWGTGLYTQEIQRDLDDRLSKLIFTARAHAPGPPPSFEPGPGDPVFRIEIPAIDVSYVVVEGVDDEQLAMGPGHYPSCSRAFEPPLCTPFPAVWPGQEGRVIVSAHRTTHSAPFLHTDQLVAGDDIVLDSPWGSFTYVVYKQMSVDDSDESIVIQRTDVRELVLTTCDPPGSASRRLITFARLRDS